MIGLAEGNPLKLSEAGNLTFIESCVYYGYMKQYKNKENETN